MRKLFSKRIERRFILKDEEGIFYIINTSLFIDYINIDIVSFIYENNEFKYIENEKERKLLKFLERKVNKEKTIEEIIDFFNYIEEFEIPTNIEEKFGGYFCYLFLKSNGLIYPQDKYKIIDFKAIELNKDEFLKYPDLFPIEIPLLNLTIHQNSKINPDNIIKDYRKKIIPIIKYKDKIYLSIEKNLKKRFEEHLLYEKSQKINDFEIEPYIELYDIDGYCSVATWEYFNENELNEPRSYPSLDFKISRLACFILDKFNLRAFEKKFNIWSEVKVLNQNFYRV